MDTNKDIIYALVNGLSATQQLSMPRMIKSLYLFDWSCVLNRCAATRRYAWSCGMCGPSCVDIEEYIKNEPKSFRTFYKDNYCGGTKLMVECVDKDYVPALSLQLQKAVRHVVRTTRGMSWNNLALLISSTMPVVISSLDKPLDLDRAAEIRRKMLGKA